MMMTNDDGTTCKECGKKMGEVSSRISHIENAKYTYDRIKGEGAFAKQEKTAMKALDLLLKEKVRIATEHALHDREDDKEENPTLYP